MTNASPDPEAANPFRRAFGDKARDPASVSDALRKAEQDDWERNARDQEMYGHDALLLAPPLIYLLSFIKNADVSLLAYQKPSRVALRRRADAPTAESLRNNDPSRTFSITASH